MSIIVVHNSYIQDTNPTNNRLLGNYTEIYAYHVKYVCI